MEPYIADRIVSINVDPQKDFMPGGSLAVAHGDEIVPKLNEMNRHTRAYGGQVIFTSDWHPAQTEHFNKWPVHCVANTDGAAFHDDLEVLSNDIIIRKGMGQTDGYSGFEGISDDNRTIAEIITPNNRERVAVLLGGLATDYCVLSTALDALKLPQGDGQLRIIVVRDAIKAVNLMPTDERDAITAMQNSGAVIVNSVDSIRGEALRLARSTDEGLLL